jgi:hypothetical protein
MSSSTLLGLAGAIALILSDPSDLAVDVGIEIDQLIVGKGLSFGLRA